MLVSVAGACSRSGKTAAAVSVLGALAPGAAAVKFTTTDDVFERCPRGSPCIVCNIDVPYRIVEDPGVLREAGTDTDRLAAAGAARVIWTIARTGAAEAAWRRVAGMIAAYEAAVMEGSTVVDLARPDALLFVVHPFLSPSRWKPASGALMARADLVVINRPAAERRDPSAAVLAEVDRHRPRALRVADVSRPLSEWAPELAERLRASAPA
jgi:hypothetical protein